MVETGVAGQMWLERHPLRLGAAGQAREADSRGSRADPLDKRHGTPVDEYQPMRPGSANTARSVRVTGEAGGAGAA